MQNQNRFVLQGGGLELVRHFAKRILDESLLQCWLFAVSPSTKHTLNGRHRVAIFVGDLLVRDCLRQTPELIKAFRSATPVDSGIPDYEWSQIGAAVSLRFHCFATVCCGAFGATVYPIRHAGMECVVVMQSAA